MASAPLAELRTRGFGLRYLTLIAGEVVSKLCVLLAFAYLARVLAPAEYGLIELSLSITVFFVLGVESGMGLYGARVVAAEPDRIPTLTPRVILLRLVLAVPTYAIVLFVSIRYAASGLGLLAVNGLAVLVSPFLTQWVFQGLRQMQWVAAGSVLRNFAFAALVFVLVRRGSDIRLVAVAEVSSIVALALFNAFILHRRLRVRPDLKGVVGGARRLFGDIWSLGLSDFMWACLWYSPGVITGWMGLSQTEHVAWIAAAVRIVMALHTFVWLYFFNMLPNLAKELSIGVGEWRRLLQRSLDTSMWPACLAAVGGTLIAPVLIPAVYGPAYQAAVRPFQIVIWMIPVAWFSGHFRFSLIAAGQQRWEFAASAATALVTVVAALVFVRLAGSVGAAAALLTGGIVNTLLALAFMVRRIETVAILPSLRPVVVATLLSLALGAGLATVAAPVWAAVGACSLYVAIGAYKHQALLLSFRS